MEHHQRRIDTVLEPEYVANLDSASKDELSEKRAIVDELENELSYYRRVLHGRLDVLDFELARRRGEETRSLIEALPEVLAGGLRGPSSASKPGEGRLHGEFAPTLPEVERRYAKVTEDDSLSRLPEISTEDLERLRVELKEIEVDLSSTRSKLQDIHDVIVAELGIRYQAADTA